MKLYTVEFKSGGYFTIYATHYKNVTPHEPEDFAFPKIEFYRYDLRICSVPRNHILEISVWPVLSTEREVVYHA